MHIDHLVYAGPDLDRAAAHVTSLLEVELEEGGRHVGFGTRNRLLNLGNGAYLEVIGPDPDQPNPAEPRPFGIDDLSAPRLVAWAVQSESIVADVSRLRSAGIDLGPVMAMQRARPGGEVLRWKLTRPTAGLLPFVIDWGGTPHPTLSLPPGPDLRGLRVETTAPGKVSGQIAAMEVEAEVVAASADRLIASVDVAGRRVVLA